MSPYDMGTPPLPQVPRDSPAAQRGAKPTPLPTPVNRAAGMVTVDMATPEQVAEANAKAAQAKVDERMPPPPRKRGWGEILTDIGLPTLGTWGGGATGATIGGLIAGPPGAAIGGILGEMGGSAAGEYGASKADIALGAPKQEIEEALPSQIGRAHV